MGIKSIVKKAGAKAADTVNKLSALSPEQLEHVEEQREKYLSEMPDPGDSAAEELTYKLLAICGVEIFNAYLPQIKDLYVPIKREVEYDGNEMDIPHNIRYFNITKWVTDKKENNLEKLVNVYQVLSNEDCNIALVFNRKRRETKVFLAVVNTKNSDNNVDVENYRKRIAEAIKGNCPGAELSDGRTCDTLPCFDNKKKYSVASATNIPTEKSEKFISQTIEKLLDGVVPNDKTQEYTLVLLATPVLDVKERKLHLADIYTALAPYASWSTNFQYSESDATNSMAIFGVNAGVSAGIQNGVNRAVTDTQGVTDTTGESVGTAETTGTTDTTGTSSSTTKTDSINAGVGANETISAGIKPFGIGADGSVGLSEFVSTGHSTAKTLGKSASHAVSESLTKNITKITNKAISNAKAVTAGVTKATNLGANFGANFARSSSVTATIGKNEGITQNYTNFNIKHALEVLEEQMKRYERGTALGMWDFAAYVVSEDQNVANNVAHTYLALTQGEESYMSSSAINLWRGDMGEASGDAREIVEYIKELRHPLFGMNPGLIEQDSDLLVYPSVVTATTSLSGKELAYSLNFPQKSVSGLPVIECAEFGRNITTYDNSEGGSQDFHIGNIFHMNHEEPVGVELSKNSLSSHAFITGSTGSGKSNTIYRILSEALEADVKFLVVEPAKGEYKDVFGMDEDVFVYGTNPKIAPLLRMNPFSFPADIHVLEHIDRLVEIFNVCWPMYAAMPAVLKEAIEKSYVDCGWDLMTSENRYSNDLFPSFGDVARNIKTIIDTSEYDKENKGAYKGSLLTRLQSLTTGINGIIFSPDEVPGENLFNRNVIVDLSRVGSTETKSLIMGMLVLKLQEYRMTEGVPMNSDLRHLTVLEEAHNILRRTAIEQPTESSNILGKSVEMIANAIAEMRTYGEGFIIADQAPGLMDMSVIRNTNTKIIMRLPDRGDRELVGKAANLDEDQIDELAKLPRGVAAIYQNEWIQPILCKVERYKGDGGKYIFDPAVNSAIIRNNEEVSDSLLKCIMDNELFQKGDKEDLRELKSMIMRSGLDSLVKVDFLDYLDAEREKGLDSLRCLVYDFLKAEEAIQDSTQYDDIHEWVEAVVEKLDPSVKDYSKKQIDLTMALILHEQTIRDISYRAIYHSFTEAYRKGGGVF